MIKLPRQIPPRIAMELALTGDFITAQRAYEASSKAIQTADDLLSIANSMKQG